MAQGLGLLGLFSKKLTVLSRIIPATPACSQHLASLMLARTASVENRTLVRCSLKLSVESLEAVEFVESVELIIKKSLFFQNST